MPSGTDRAANRPHRSPAWRLCSSAERFDLLVRSSDRAILILARDFRVLDFAGNAESVFGRSVTEALGTSYLDSMVRRGDRPSVESALQSVLRGEKSKRLEHDVRPHAGEARELDRTVRVHVAPLCGVARAPEALLLVAHDVTDEQRAAALLNANAEHLSRAQPLAEIEARTDRIAHDFNNVLTVMLAGVQRTLEDRALGAETRASLEALLPAVERGSRLVQELQYLASGERRPRSVVDLVEVVEDVLRLLEPALPSSIHVRAELPKDHLPVMGDLTELQQLVTNLCSNAADAMRATGGHLEVSLVSTGDEDAPPDQGPTCRRDAAATVRLRVTDTGHGIDPGLLHEIFEPFFTTKHPDRGTGMGLTVAREIARSHGGSITVRSEPDRGARFEVKLPAVADPTASEEPHLPSPRNRSEPLDQARALLAHARALLRTRGARSEKAIRRALSKAQDIVDDVGADLYAPLILVERAELARLTGDHAARRRELRKARHLFARIGAKHHGDRILRERAS